MKRNSSNFALIIISCLFWISSAQATGTLPAGISNLTALTGTNEGEIVLKWTAPGDDEMTGSVTTYVVKHATSQIDSVDFNTLWVSTYNHNWADFLDGSEEESRILTGLPAGATLYFAIKGVDDAVPSNYGVWYSTDELSVNTSNFAPVQKIVPSAVTNLSALTGWRRVTLSWTAPGDDGSVGNISNGEYEIRCSTVSSIINESDW